MTALVIASAEPEAIALASITRDPALLCRAAGVDAVTVAEYAAAMRAGVAFPPVVVFGPHGQGKHWLADGFHRCAAAELAGLTEVAADLRPGGRREALLHAAGANASHGLRRTNADKRRAVLLVIEACPKWSDRKIGELCGVDGKTVAAARQAGAEIPHEPGADPHTPDVDRLVAKLTKALTRVFQRWPAERRAELRKVLDAADEAERST